jgi:hypothetical protein
METNTLPKSKEYNRKRRKVVSGFLAWLFEYTCQDCRICNETKVLDFHHLDPTQKINSVSKIVKSGRYLQALQEVLKCVYLCNVCHYKRHNQSGDLDEEFKAINRRRHSCVQNLLGCSE